MDVSLSKIHVDGDVVILVKVWCSVFHAFVMVNAKRFLIGYPNIAFESCSRL